MNPLCHHNNSQNHANDVRFMQMEQEKHAGVPSARRLRYSIDHLTEIGYQSEASADISKFETEAIEGKSDLYPKP